MGKLTDKQKKQIIAEYIECQNYSEVARKHKVSWTTVKNIVSKDKSSVKRMEQKKEENTLDMLAYLGSRKDQAQLFVDQCFKGLLDPEKMEKASLQQIATSLAIVIDKFARISDQSNATQQVQDLLSRIKIGGSDE